MRSQLLLWSERRCCELPLEPASSWDCGRDTWPGVGAEGGSSAPAMCSEPRGCLRTTTWPWPGEGQVLGLRWFCALGALLRWSAICPPLHEVCQVFLLNGRESYILANWFKFEAVFILTCLLQGWTVSVNSRDFRKATIQKFLWCDCLTLCSVRSPLWSQPVLATTPSPLSVCPHTHTNLLVLRKDSTVTHGCGCFHSIGLSEGGHSLNPSCVYDRDSDWGRSQQKGRHVRNIPLVQWQC